MEHKDFNISLNEEKMEKFLTELFPEIGYEWWWENNEIRNSPKQAYVLVIIGAEFCASYLEDAAKKAGIPLGAINICTDNGRLALEISKFHLN